MRTIISATALVLALVFGYGAAGSVAHDMISKGEETPRINKLLGKQVKNPQGENLGTISDFVKGPEGRVTFAILKYWVSDDTQKEVAVPLGALSCEGKDCILNASREALDSSRLFVSKDELARPKPAEDIYRYFGLQPYWTEEGTEK